MVRENISHILVQYSMHLWKIWFRVPNSSLMNTFPEYIPFVSWGLPLWAFIMCECLLHVIFLLPILLVTFIMFKSV